MPRCAQIRFVGAGEGRVARAHQLFGRLRDRGAGQIGAAAGVETGAAAWARWRWHGGSLRGNRALSAIFGGCESVRTGLESALRAGRYNPVQGKLVLNAIEKQKIDKVVGEFVESRRPPLSMRAQVDLAYRLTGQSVELFEIRPVWQGNGETREDPIAKATFVRTRGIWQLYWQRADLKWHAYEPLPKARTLEEIVAEIDADPCCCFWG